MTVAQFTYSQYVHKCDRHCVSAKWKYIPEICFKIMEVVGKNHGFLLLQAIVYWAAQFDNNRQTINRCISECVHPLIAMKISCRCDKLISIQFFTIT